MKLWQFGLRDVQIRHEVVSHVDGTKARFTGIMTSASFCSTTARQLVLSAADARGGKTKRAESAALSPKSVSQ